MTHYNSTIDAIDKALMELRHEPGSREASLARTKLEEAQFWAEKARTNSLKDAARAEPERPPYQPDGGILLCDGHSDDDLVSQSVNVVNIAPGSLSHGTLIENGTVPADQIKSAPSLASLIAHAIELKSGDTRFFLENDGSGWSAGIGGRSEAVCIGETGGEVMTLDHDTPEAALIDLHERIIDWNASQLSTKNVVIGNLMDDEPKTD